ncbi:MAG: hypothetical protein ABIH76_05150 [Candidatus Bathyarchaeota archaeon]
MEFITAYLLTILVEMLIAWLYMNKHLPAKKVLLSVLIVNTVTLPFVWFFFPQVMSEYIFFIVFSEMFAFFTEAILYVYLLKLKPFQAATLSLIANLPTFLIGLL